MNMKAALALLLLANAPAFALSVSVPSERGSEGCVTTLIEGILAGSKSFQDVRVVSVDQGWISSDRWRFKASWGEDEGLFGWILVDVDSKPNADGEILCKLLPPDHTYIRPYPFFLAAPNDHYHLIGFWDLEHPLATVSDAGKLVEADFSKF